METSPLTTTNQPETHLEELWNYRFLLRNLIVRDLKVRYKGSALGILWSLLNPLMIMLVFTVVFSKFTGAQIRAYPVFVLVGIMPWNFFNGSIFGGVNSIVGNAPLIKKVYFPREILPLATVTANLVNFLIAFVVLAVFLYAYDLSLTVHAGWVVIILLSQMMFTLGLVYFFSAAQVFYRDVAQILDVGMLAFFFLTPIFYSLDQFCRTEILGITFEPARVMRWANPMASIVDAYRTVLWGTLRAPIESCGAGELISGPPTGMGLDFIARTVVTTFLVLVAGYAVFRRTEYLFGEKL